MRRNVPIVRYVAINVVAHCLDFPVILLLLFNKCAAQSFLFSESLTGLSLIASLIFDVPFIIRTLIIIESMAYFNKRPTSFNPRQGEVILPKSQHPALSSASHYSVERPEKAPIISLRANPSIFSSG